MPPTAKKRTCKFTEDLQKEFPFLQKCLTPSEVRCNKCNGTFSVAHGGRHDIQRHLTSDKHKKALTAASTSSSLTSYFRHEKYGDKEAELAKAEALWAFHTVCHNQSFRSMECTSKLIQKVFDKKFCCGKTKCEAIAKNVIAPYSSDILKTELNDVPFICISTDASNHKDIKIFPTLVRYFHPTTGINVKILDLVNLPGETAQIIYDSLMEILEKHNLKEKVVGYCADNANTNFGGVQREGQCNVFRKLEEGSERQIVGVGCAAHIAHNAIQTAADLLPVDVEHIVMKIYSYFYIYTVRVEDLKDFCEEAEMQYKRILGYCKTRWLALLPAVERILQMYSPLKSYFLSQDKCPAVLHQFFSNECSELWLKFVHVQASVFNDSVKMMEGDKASFKPGPQRQFSNKTCYQNMLQKHIFQTSCPQLLFSYCFCLISKMSSDEEDVAAVVAIVDLILRRNKKRFRVRPYLQSRSFNIYQELKIDDRFGLKNFFRCSESDFQELLSLILPDIEKKTTRNDVIPPAMRLGATLRFLATGDSYSSIMYHLRISKQALSKLIPDVCLALYNRLKNVHLKLPSTAAEWRKISRGFDTKWNFPHALGALDGKHVIIEAPANTGSLYFNYKKTFSVVLLGMADYDYNFTYIDVGCQGRIADGGVFRNSTLFRSLNNNTLSLPEDEPLPGEDMNLPYVILADDAFPMSHYLMKPYSGDHRQGSSKRVFNYRLCRARRIIENVFGILTSVFRVFKRPLTVEVDTVIPIILACVVLHNYLRRNKTSRNIYTPLGTFDIEENGELIRGQWRNEPAAEGLQPLPRIPRRSPIDSHEIRDGFASYFVSERGMVPWQNFV